MHLQLSTSFLVRVRHRVVLCGFVFGVRAKGKEIVRRVPELKIRVPRQPLLLTAVTYEDAIKGRKQRGGQRCER